MGGNIPMRIKGLLAYSLGIRRFSPGTASVAGSQIEKMKAFLVCVLVAAFAAESFGHHLELCGKNDGQLKSELQCIRRSISAAANQSFDNAARALRCQDNSCVIRKLCVGNDLEKAMAKYFTRAQITEIHHAATACDPNAAHHH